VANVWMAIVDWGRLVAFCMHTGVFTKATRCFKVFVWCQLKFLREKGFQVQFQI